MDEYTRPTMHLRFAWKYVVIDNYNQRIRVLQQLWNHRDDPEGLGDGVWKTVESTEEIADN